MEAVEKIITEGRGRGVRLPGAATYDASALIILTSLSKWKALAHDCLERVYVRLYKFVTGAPRLSFISCRRYDVNEYRQLALSLRRHQKERGESFTTRRRLICLTNPDERLTLGPRRRQLSD